MNTAEESLDLARAAVRDGTTTVVATPHVRSDFVTNVEGLRDRGFGVVLAHPERSAGLLGARRTALDHEVGAGSVLQVNACAIIGDYGAAARATVLQLVRRGIASAIASDAHGSARPPALSLAQRSLDDEGIGPAAVRELIDSGPRRLLARGLEPIPARLA